MFIIKNKARNSEDTKKPLYPSLIIDWNFCSDYFKTMKNSSHLNFKTIEMRDNHKHDRCNIHPCLNPGDTYSTLKGAALSFPVLKYYNHPYFLTRVNEDWMTFAVRCLSKSQRGGGVHKRSDSPRTIRRTFISVTHPIFAVRSAEHRVFLKDDPLELNKFLDLL